ncbi:MAG TPA: CpaF family protein [Gaiellaceae bacterium]|nr:CpaF family protein [Gaiellaceae bacterium]
MGLHDRLNKGDTNGGTAVADAVAPSSTAVREPRRPAGIVDPYAELKTRVHHAVVATVGVELFKQDKTDDLQDHVLRAVTEQLLLDRTPLTRDERRQIVSEITDDILGYGPIEPLLRDESVTEVMVNAFDRIYCERHGKLERTTAAFADDAHVLRIIDKIVSQVGRRVDEASPMVDARLPDGSRVNAIIPPLALKGPTLTIRKFSRDPYRMDDLISFGSISAKAAQFLAVCVRGKLNILISGGTGTGKTTTLNAMSAFIPDDERIVTIEDAAELQLQQEHVITLESRPPNIEGQGEVRIRELVRNALRMRPDRIIVGEVRGAETLDMLQAMNTGHEGSLTTIHANSPRDALARLETLVLTAGVDLPLRAIREQIASAFDLLIQITRLVDGTRRVTHVTEVLRMESDVVTLQDIFVARPPDESAPSFGGRARLLSSLTCTGLKPQCLDKLATNGVILPASFFTPDDEVGPAARDANHQAEFGGAA